MKTWLADLRKEKNLSQDDIATKIGSTRQLISAIENGARPGIDTAKKIAEVLNIDWTRFYEEDRKEAM